MYSYILESIKWETVQVKYHLLGDLPVPLWEDGTQSTKNLAKQAKSNAKPRLNQSSKTSKEDEKNNAENVVMEDVGSQSPVGDSTHKRKGNENKYVTKSNITSYTKTIPTCNVLLIGLSYNRSIVEQYEKDDTITNISMCLDQKGRQIETSVARDTFCCYIIAKSFPHVKIFTVNKCTNAIRSC